MVSLTSQFSVDFSLICNSPHLILKFLFSICYLSFNFVYNVWRILQNGRTWTKGGGLKTKVLNVVPFILRNWIQYSLSRRNSWFNYLCLSCLPKLHRSCSASFVGGSVICLTEECIGAGTVVWMPYCGAAGWNHVYRHLS